MTKAELIEQRVQQLLDQNWDRPSAQAEAERMYADAEEVAEAPKRETKKSTKVVEAAVEEKTEE